MQIIVFINYMYFEITTTMQFANIKEKIKMQLYEFLFENGVIQTKLLSI